MKTMSKGNIIKNFLKNKKENMMPRQDLKKVYIRSGSFYLIRVLNMMKENTLVSSKCYGIVVKNLEAANIDTIEDFNILEMQLNKWN